MPEADYGMSNQWLTVCTVDPKKLGIDQNKIIHAMEKEYRMPPSLEAHASAALIFRGKIIFHC